VSAEIMAILDTFSPLVEAVSVDEAFVDLTGTEGIHGSPLEAVRRIKARIVETTPLPASAGPATSQFVAKVASPAENADGLVVVPAGHEASFLAPLAIERIWGVGKVMAAELRSLGLATIGQLQAYPRRTLVQRFGRHGESLHELAFGRDDSPVEPFAPATSMAAAKTSAADCRDAGTLTRTLREQAERIARELRSGNLAAARVTLKLRFSDFRTVTRAWTGEPTQEGLEIFRRAAMLLDRERVTEPIRLIGLSTSSFRPEATGQLSLLDPAAVAPERLARATGAP